MVQRSFGIPAILGPKMAASFPRFSWWLWSGSKGKVPVSNGSSVNSLNSSLDGDFGPRESDTRKFPSKTSSTKRNGKGKGKSNSVEGRFDRECDVVVVPSDGVCLSGYESDGPEWSIGWEEPHGPGFQADHEIDGGFAVLVPCYKSGCKALVEGSNNQLLAALKDIPNALSSGGNNSMQWWFSSIQNF